MSTSVGCRECGVHLKAENETAHMRKAHPRVAFESGGRPQGRRERAPLYLTSRTKKAIFAVLISVVFVVAGTMLVQSLQKGTPIDADATPVRVSMSGFNPSTVVVKVGSPLKIDLINMDNQYHTDGGGWHNFAMDDFGMNVTVAPLGQEVFAVPTHTPGTYGWYCNLCCGGRASPSMNGRVIVEP